MTKGLRKRIVLVEDDHFESKDFANDLRTALGNVEVEAISCEAEFLDRYGSRPVVMPDVFVIDLMLEWRQGWVASTRPLPVPAPFQDEAGLRCLEAIRKYDREVPVILWTITNKELPPSVIDNKRTFYLRKDRAVEHDLSMLIRKFVSA